MFWKLWMQGLLEDSQQEEERQKWIWVKRLRKPYAIHNTCLKNAEGETCNMRDTSKEFANYLSNKHWGPSSVLPPTTTIPPSGTAPIEKGPITVAELRGVLKKCKHNKAPGPDDIPLEPFKLLTDEQLEELARLFTKCSTQPQHLKTGN